MLSLPAVLRETAHLYRTFFARTIVTTALVFAVVCLVESVGTWPLVVLSFIGTAVVQGALVEAVEQKRSQRSESLTCTTWRRAGALLGVSVLTGVGIALGLFLFVAPGLVLFTQWSLAVPAVMIEGRSPRDAMRRSRELVHGHGWQVFAVFAAVTVAAGLVSYALERVLIDRVGLWLSLTVASTLTTPFAAHALNVVYYRIVGVDSALWRSTVKQKTA